jgi:hypothetical protein
MDREMWNIDGVQRSRRRVTRQQHTVDKQMGKQPAVIGP